MSKKQPAAPAPPDYAAANREAVMADLETLPMRRLIEAQARMGTGQFEGLGDADIAAREYAAQLAFAPQATQALLDLQRQYGSDFVDLSRAQAQQYDPTGFALREGFGGRLAGGANSVESLYQQTQGGTAPDYASYVRSNPDLLRNWETNTSRNTGMSIEEYGRQHYEQAGRSEGRGLPTTTTAGTNVPPAYEQVAGNGPALGTMGSGPVLGEMGSYTTQSGGPNFASVGNGPGLARMSGAGQLARMGAANPQEMAANAAMIDGGPALARMGGGPGFERLGAASYADTGMTAAGRSELERQVMDDLARAGTMDPAVQRAAEQAARARGSASGNLYGGGNAIQEALSVQLAQRDQDASRRAAALGLLNSGQSTSDTANRMAEANMAAQAQAIGQRNAASQQEADNLARSLGFNNAAALQEYQNRTSAGQQNFQNQLAAIGQRNAASQQNYANEAARIAQNNTATQGDFDNLGRTLTFNNASSQQEADNAYRAAGFNNTTAQQGYQNQFNANQANFENQLASMGFNNAARQQGFQNQQAAVGFNNQAAQQGFANSLEAINQRNQSRQNQFSAAQGQTQQRAAARQQDLANIQSFLGLAPVAQIAGYNQNAQQGASPFSSFSYGDRLASNVNQNAGQLGTNFAQGVFGTQAGIYGSQLQNSGSPLGSLAGSMFGAATGGIGQAMGSRLGQKWF